MSLPEVKFPQGFSLKERLEVNVAFITVIFNVQKELRWVKLGSYFSLKFVIPYFFPLINCISSQ